MPALRKLALARSLWASAQAAEDTARTEDRRFHAQVSAQRYKSRILGLSAPAIHALDPYTPIASAWDLADYLDQLVADDAPAEEVYVAQVHAETLLQKLDHAAGVLAMDDWKAARDAVRDKLARRGDTINALYEKTVLAAGQVLDDETIAAAKAVTEQADTLRARIHALHRQHQEQTAQDRDDITGLSTRVQAALAELRQYAYGTPEYRQAERAYQEAQVDEIAKSDWYKTQKLELQRQENELRAQSEQALTAVGQQVIQKALAQSPVSPERAERWVESLGIDQDKSLKAKLKRIDYPIDQFKADVAECYRLTGGKLAKVRFNVERGQRASAEGIATAGKGVINVKGEFSKRVLFHEMAHHLEADPIGKQLSRAFIFGRRTSDKTQTLRKLTGNRGYDSSERAWPDDFLNPYVGKEYPDGVTEVCSMGIERFSDPASLARAIAKDPEHIGLMLGYAGTPESALFQGLKNLVSEATAVQQQREAVVEQELEALLDRVDALIPLEQLPEPNLSPMDKKYAQLSTYLGSVGEWAIYKAKRRYINGNRRLSPCLVVMNRNHFANMEPVHSTDIRGAKAVIASYQALGVFPSQTHRDKPHSDPRSLRAIIENFEASNA